MGLLDLPRNTALPRLNAITDREILEKARRYEQAMAAWQTKANALRRATTALQGASDALYAAASLDRPDARGLDPAEAEERARLLEAISRLDRHLAPLD